MPEPRGGESLRTFVGRYMGSSRAERDFPERKQRAAVAYSEWREKRKKRREREEKRA